MQTSNVTFTVTEGNIVTNNQQQLSGALMIEKEPVNAQTQ